MTKNRRRNQRRAWMAVILWMILIFAFSAQPGNQSSGLSTGVTEIFLKFIQELVPYLELELGVFHYLIRKAAHFTIYLILGILVMNALRQSGVEGRKAILRGLLICILYAISDEVHQL